MGQKIVRGTNNFIVGTGTISMGKDKSPADGHILLGQSHFVGEDKFLKGWTGLVGTWTYIQADRGTDTLIISIDMYII